jgi:HSP20 family protein
MAQSSFFKRLTNTLRVPDHEEFHDTDDGEEKNSDLSSGITADHHDGQLGVDVYEVADAIYIKAMIAGVLKHDLDITLTRETVTLHGARYDDAGTDATYLYQELYWGAFSRVIELPTEVDIDQAEASEKNGLLTIKLPKIDKQRMTKLDVK